MFFWGAKNRYYTQLCCSARVRSWPLAAASVEQQSRQLLGVKRTPRVSVVAAAYDPKPTSACAPWVWTRSLVRNMNGAWSAAALTFVASLRQATNIVRSMTLRRGGWLSDLMPPCKSVDIGESGHDRQ